METIAPKIFNQETNSFEPDLSLIDLSKYAVQSFNLNPDGESYTVDLKWIADYPRVISPAQGRAMLDEMGKLDAIEQAIPSLPKKAQIFWEYAIEWWIENEFIQQIATQFEINLEEFFKEASKIE